LLSSWSILAENNQQNPYCIISFLNDIGCFNFFCTSVNRGNLSPDKIVNFIMKFHFNLQTQTLKIVEGESFLVLSEPFYTLGGIGFGLDHSEPPQR